METRAPADVDAPGSGQSTGTQEFGHTHIYDTWRYTTAKVHSGEIMKRAMEQAGIGKRSSPVTRTATDPTSLVSEGIPVAVPVAAVVEAVKRSPKTPYENPMHSRGGGSGAGEAIRLPSRSPGSRRNFYAVYRGLTPGVYQHWSVASLQVTGVKGNSYKGFDTLGEAVASMREAGFTVNDEGLVESKKPGK